MPDVEQHVKLPQGRPRVHTLQVVLGAEQALTSGLTLALGDRAQAVEAAGDGGQESLLGLHVGGDRPEQGRLRLVGAVGAPEALDGGVGLPAGLQQIVHAQALVPRAEVGVVAAPGAAGVAEHQDALLVVLERLRLGEVGRPRPALDGKAPVAGAVHLGDDAPGPAGDLGHAIRAEVLHDLVERTRHRVQRRQVLDQPVAPLHRLAALHGLAVAEHRARGQVAVAVGVLLEQLRREGVRKVAQSELPRRDVNGHVSHSSVGMSASRRSISASPVETS